MLLPLTALLLGCFAPAHIPSVPGPLHRATPSDPPEATQDSTQAKANTLTSIAVLGASVSAGMGNAKELQVRKDVPLGVFLQGALPEGRLAETEFLDLGNTYFFMHPYVHGELQTSRAKKFDPTLVVALDFLFWFAYGEPWAKGKRRAEGLEAGLEMLSRFDCPMVVGDLPDIDHALAGVGPFGFPIVTRAMFPTTPERLAMNARIAEWASTRGNVTIVPLGSLITKMIATEPIELRGNTWTVDSIPEALQKDRLHPTVKGSAWTGLHVADAIARLDPSLTERFRFDPSLIQGRVLALTEPARAAKRRSGERLAARLAKWKQLRTGASAPRK